MGVFAAPLGLVNAVFALWLTTGPLTDGPIAFAHPLAPAVAAEAGPSASGTLPDVEPPPGEARIVQPGESLWSIFIALCQDRTRWPEFLKANRHLAQPVRLAPGDRIIIPRGWSKTAPAAPPAETVVPPPPAPDTPRAFIGSGADYALTIGLLAALIGLAVRPPRRPPVRLAVAALSVFLGLRYLYWRGAYTLNTDGTVGTGLSLALYLAEVFGFCAALLFYILAAGVPRRVEPSPQREGAPPSVDVFITVLDQPLDVLYRTLIGCLAMDYPAGLRTVYVLDGSMRLEVRQMVEALGGRYLVCPPSGSDGAGRLNDGLTRSSGDLVMVLQCGDVPVGGFLRKTVGWFDRPETAFVQTAMHTPTPDPFQQALLLGREIAHEQELFLKIVQPGLDRFGAAVALGSAVIYRRSALVDASGFRSDRPDADLELSASLHSRRWRSVYLDRNLTLRTVTEDPASYFHRRADGIRRAARLLLKGLPVRPHLTFGQRWVYLGLVLNDLLVLPRLAFMAAPVPFLVGAAPIVAPLELLLLYFLPFYIGQAVARHRLSDGRRHPVWSAVYETADLSAAAAAAARGPKPAGRSVLVLPPLILAGVQALGLAAGIFLWMSAAVPGTLIFIGGVWAIYNLYLLGAAGASAYGRLQKRDRPRLFRPIACRLITPERAWTVETADLSETGLSLRMKTPSTLPRHVEAELAGEPALRLPGEVRRNEAFPWGGASIGIRFGALSDRQRRDLIRCLYCPPEAWEDEDAGVRTQAAALAGFLTAPARVFLHERDLRRSAPRYEIARPGRLILRDRIIQTETMDVSATGASLRVEEDPGPIPPPATLEVRISDQTLSATARQVWSRRLSEHWEIGLRFDPDAGRRLLDAVLPAARVKVVPEEDLQARVLRLLGRSLAYVFSLAVAVGVVAVFIRMGALPALRSARFEDVSKYLWLTLLFILVDGIKIYIEIAGRARPRRYESDLSQVTALIPCRNTGKAVEYTIEGLRRILPDDRILIIDDASTDDTAEIARRTGVRVFSLKENVGKPRAIGLGLQWVQTRYTLILDDDTRIQALFLPTSLLEEGNTGVAFYVLPCRRSRENYDGKEFVNCLQRYEYAKSMEIGRRFQDKTLSVSCISGAVGLFKTDRLRALYPLHTNLFPGEDLERTLIDLLHDGRVAFVSEPVWTVCPDNWRALTRQRLLNWNPGFFRLFGYYLKILLNRKMPGRLRFEMLYNIYVVFSDPLKIYSLLALLFYRYWGGLLFIYFFYLALEIYPFLTVEKKMPVIRYYLPAFFLYPLYGIYNTVLRFTSLFIWLWHRYVTQKWKPKPGAAVA